MMTVKPVVGVVVNQRPFPPFHGSNADSMRILTALHLQKVEVHCVSWKDSIAIGPIPDELTDTTTTYREFDMLPWSQIAFSIRRRPGFLEGRLLTEKQISTTVSAFRAAGVNVILCVGLHGSHLARRLAAELSVPMVFRSHAIESDYFRQFFHQRALLDSPSHKIPRRPLADRMVVSTIRRFERKALTASSLVLEISEDDLRCRQRRPGNFILHFPPCAPTELSVDIEDARKKRTWDVGYIGNLFTPNNQRGLLWFLEYVLPILRRSRPELSMVIAGKATDRMFVKRLLAHDIELIQNPDDALVVARKISVGVNPIFSGNGTTLKTIDMLWSGSAVVTTSMGSQGYNFGFRHVPLAVATNARDFARYALLFLDDGVQDIGVTRTNLHEFSLEAIGPRLEMLLTRQVNSTMRFAPN
jgi:polysaccharide biosynthesis protein PslH